MYYDSNKPQEQEQEREVPLKPIIDMGSAVVKNKRGTIHCLTIIGQIEGHMNLPESTKTTKYEHVLPLVAAIEQSEDIDGLLLLLNTVGGDVEAGLGIAELVAGMKKPTATLVLGGGHSIGVPLAVCGKATYIAPSASMTIHPVRMGGTVIAAPATYRYFERLQERIIDFVASHSRIGAENFRELMLSVGDMANDVGSVIYGSEAVALGLMDHMGTLHDALEFLYASIEQEKKKAAQ